MWFLAEKQKGKPGNLQKQCFFGKRENCVQKYFEVKQILQIVDTKGHAR